MPSPLLEEIEHAFRGQFRMERSPSSVLNILLLSGKSNLERTRSSGVQVIWDAYNRYISSGCFVFIDSFDQALNKLFSDNLDIWCAAQTGLMKAAWEMSRHNRHSKIFTTIRQEAYASFSDSERINVRGSLLVIEYSKDDLEELFKHAISFYEDIDNIEDFLGFEKVYNAYLKTHEKVFDYIYRHTTGVPRWLMTIGTGISQARKSRKVIRDPKKKREHQKYIVDMVSRISAEELAYIYLKGEMRLFFKGDDPETFVDNLLSKINSSVLSLSNIERIAAKFVKEHIWDGTKHPFCLLYNLGLIGLVMNGAGTGNKRQMFKKPYEFDWNFENILPKDPSTYYLLHPSLHYLIQKKNFRFNFNKVNIGDGLSWGKKEEARIQNEILRIFISYADDDWERVEGIVEKIEEYLNVKSVLHDIWLDKWKMKGGKWFQEQMISGIASSDFLVFMVSESSLSYNSVVMEWMSKFDEKIRKSEYTIFPFIIDNTPFDCLPFHLKSIWAYRYNDDRQNIEKLIDDVIFWKQEQTTERKTDGCMKELCCQDIFVNSSSGNVQSISNAIHDKGDNEFSNSVTIDIEGKDEKNLSAVSNEMGDFHKVLIPVVLTLGQEEKEFSSDDAVALKLSIAELLNENGIKLLNFNNNFSVTFEVSLGQADRLIALHQQGLTCSLNILAIKKIGDEAAAHKVDVKKRAGLYDVFMCHNSEDKSEVKNIAINLRGYGLLPWLDEWELRPGFPWQKTLGKEIGKIRSAAIFIGKSGIGPWQDFELMAFLRQFKKRNCPVIPVLLEDALGKFFDRPESDDTDFFLEGMQVVDFRVNESDPYNQLFWGITGEEIYEAF